MIAGAKSTADFLDELEKAARRAEGRCGVLVSRTAVGLMQATISDQIPKRQIWTSWGSRYAMDDEWPSA